MNKANKRKLAMYAEANPGATVYVILKLAKPLLHLLCGFIWLSSEHFDICQDTAAARNDPRSYRVSEAAQQSYLTKFRKEVDHLMHSEHMFLPSAGCTMAMRALMFRLLSRCSCAVHHYLTVSHRNCPYGLFKALTGGALEVQDIPLCLQDELTTAILSDFPTYNELQSEECQQILSSIAHSFQIDILNIEAAHASTRRLITLRSVQTWALSMEQLNTEFILRKIVCLREPFMPSGRMCARNQTSKKRKRQEAAAHQPRIRSDNKQKVGYGGTWRAFMRTHVKGIKFKQVGPTIKRMRLRYHLLKASKDSEWSLLEHLGVLATLAGQQGAVPFPRLEEAATPNPGILQDDFGSRAVVPFETAGDVVQAELRQLRQESRVLSSLAATEREQMASDVVEAGKMHKQLLGGQQGQSSELVGALGSGSYHCLPGHLGQPDVAYFVAPADLLEIFKKTGSARKRYGHGLWTPLMNEWHSLNRLVRHSEHAVIQTSETRETSKSMCLEQGTCICKSFVWHYHCKFIALMCKPHFLPKREARKQSTAAAAAEAPKASPQPAGPSAGSAPSQPKPKKKAVKTPHRVLAEQGFLVVRVSACKGRVTRHADNPWVQLAAKRAGHSAELPAITDGGVAAGQEQEDQLEQSLWFHLGFMNYRTWQCTVTPLNYSHSDDEGVHLYAQDPLGCCLHLDFVKQNQDLKAAWVAQYYTVHSTGATLAPADMLPAHVIVRTYKGLPPLKVWLGEEMEARMRHQRARGGRGGQRQQGGSRASHGAAAGQTSRSAGSASGSAALGHADPDFQAPASDTVIEDRPNAKQLPSGDEASGSDKDHTLEDRLVTDDPTPLDEAAEDLEHDDVPDISGAQASSSSVRPVKGPADASAPSDAAAPRHGRGGGAGGGEKSGTEVVFDLGQGASIRYYPVSNVLQAYCRLHGSDCRKTRTVKAGRQEHQGRPLGFLLSWLKVR
ncbi:unnamed protein product [Symbiodinium sp. CCMP2592]|nr:unnamed protein product [Symbiodinium sp. CCMP2592]